MSLEHRTTAHRSASRLMGVLLGGILLMNVMPAKAQEFKRLDTITATGTAFRVFAKEGEATVQVLVIGSVPSPGLYEVGIGIGLDQLVALTGGSPLASSTSNTTEHTVRLFRRAGEQRDLIYEAPLDRMVAEPDLYPLLEDGDVLMIESFTTERARLNWQDAVNLIASLATVILLVERLF